MTFARGTVILISLDPTVGHEQRGTRPCVVVSDPAVIADQRFPLLGVVPLTGTPGTGALYPLLSPGTSGIAKPSYALIDHVRSIDKQRVLRAYGQVRSAELQAISAGLRRYFGLADPGV